MMKRLIVLSFVALLGPRLGIAQTDNPDGAEEYALNCAACHDPGPGHPGTMMLSQLGRPVPSLIGRNNLQFSYLQWVVRHGLIEMPPFRPTELSDQQIEDIYDYIKSAKLPDKK